MPLSRQLLFCLLALALILALFESTSIDLWLQNYFYDAGATEKPPLERWLIYKHDKELEFWFHTMPKALSIAFGVGMFILFLTGLSYQPLKAYRNYFLFMGLSLGLVAGLVGGAKHLTNVHCPNRLVLYGGEKPYVKVLQEFPPHLGGPKQGRCFPAGHATAGFGFMALYFVFRRRAAKIAGLTFGLLYGWTIGIFQMLRGEHFLSHTLFSMVASWMVILLIVIAFDRTKMVLNANSRERQ